MLSAADFPAFYEKIHGQTPFPWQRGLAERVLTGAGWPDLVDVPTGLGKTSVLDIAVFAAAVTAEQPGSVRVGRRRTLFVVDRRIVVDEATAHAETISVALQAAADGAQDGVVGAVARAIRSYAPDAGGDVLAVTRMRGGVTWDDAWLDRPDRPGIVVSTVDQVGSRLLFRGYGVSDRRKPIDAALVGTDALLLVDEAHLAEALTTTVVAAAKRDRLALPLPGLRVVQLTATPNAETDAAAARTITAGDAVSRYDFDVDVHLADREAGRRLTAQKSLFLLEVTPKNVVKQLADAAAYVAAPATTGGSEGWPPVVLAVCNTVDRARAVHTQLVARAVGRDGQPTMDVELLIGRSRPADRGDLQERILRRFGNRRTRADRPAVLVATQTVEVGINIDVDALVTESASWDALVQRLGRLNRLGVARRRRPGHTCPAVVVHDGQTDGPVYGAARDVTWAHLTERCATIDAVSDIDRDNAPNLPVSPLRCRDLLPGIGRDPMPAEAIGARPDIPVLQVPTLDAWACTAPIPSDDPPIESFLHGVNAGTPAVQVTWRDGLISEQDALDDFFADEDDPVRDVDVRAATANALLTAMPVRPAEQAEIPFNAVRRWIQGETPAPVSDVDSGTPEPDPRPRAKPEPFQVLRWTSGGTGSGPASGSWVWVEGSAVRPGDQIVVPTRRGGLDEYGWHPATTRAVRDVTEQAAFDHARTARPGRQRLVLKIDARLPSRLGLEEPARSTLAARISTLYAGEETDAPTAEAGEQEGSDTSTSGRGEAVRKALIEAIGAVRAVETGALPDLPVGLAAETLRGWLHGTPQPRLVEVSDPEAAAVVGGGAGRTPLLYLLAGGRLPAAGGNSVVLPSADRVVVEGNDDDPVASSVSPGRVSLAQHHTRVRDRATEIAAALQLGPDLTAVVAAAAYWHDLGKVEDRFQAMLHGGDPYEAMVAPEPLAKSGLPPEDRAAWRRSRVLSGLPAGARHEAWSVALAGAYLAQRTTPYPGDTELLLHLIAAHHGHARPLLPLIVDRDPRPIRTTIDGITVQVPSEDTVCLKQPARFAALNARYGRWGLALLETVVRCADTTVSAEGS